MRQRRWAIVILGILAALSAIGLSLRAYLGPGAIAAIRLGSPLGCESALSASLLLILVARSNGPTPEGRTNRAGIPAYWGPALLVLIAGIFVVNLTAPFLSDDYILIQMPSIHETHIWSLFQTPGGDGSFRPLGDLYFSAVQMFAARDPLRWHIAGLSIHLLNCVLLFTLVLLLWRDRALAAASALVFSVHGTRAEAVAWTAASFDLLAASCVFASAVLYFSKIPKWISWPFALMFAAAGVMCKESAYAFPLFLICIAYAAGRVNRDVLVFTTLISTIYAALFVYRWHLFHGPGGYIDPATGRLQIFSLQPVSTAKALLVRVWAILFFPVNWISPLGGVTKLAVAAGSVALILLVLKTASVPRTALLGLLAAVLVCTIPVIHLALIGDSALGSRYLYLPAAGFCVLIGLLATNRTPRSALWGVAGYAFFLVTVTLHNLAAWRSVAARADQVCTELAGSPDTAHGRAPSIVDGVYFFGNGLPACIEMKRQLK
jgi:hypothetical protein